MISLTQERAAQCDAARVSIRDPRIDRRAAGAWLAGLRWIAALAVSLALLVTMPATASGFAENFGGEILYGNSVVTATAADSASNRYLAGYFDTVTATFGATTLVRIGNFDAFVVKMDASGNVLWARNFGGAGASAYGRVLAVDGSGNVYLGGYFGNANLTTPALSRIGDDDAFVIRLAGASGGVTWAQNFGGSGAFAAATAVAVDGAGSVYLGGYFQNASLTTPALTKIGNSDVFAIRLAAEGGAVTWAQNFGGGGADAIGQALAVDGAGGVYLGGYVYSGNLTTPALAKIGSYDAFVFKLAAESGGVTWARNFGGANALAYGQALGVDHVGSVYLAGIFSSGGLTTPAISRIGTIDAFVFKLAATNGDLAWAQNFGGVGASILARALAVDATGSVYLGGNFGAANLTTPALTKIGTVDVFAIKLAAVNGGVTWARNFGGASASAFGLALAVDSSGGIYVGGDFQNANLTTPPLVNSGGTDAFAIELAAGDGAIRDANRYGSVDMRPGGNVRAQSVATDTAGNHYIAGYFESTTAAFGNTTLTRIGTRDAIVAKLDPSGKVLWAQNFGGAGASTNGTAVTIDDSGDVYLAGDFIGASLSTPPLPRMGWGDGFVIKLGAATGGLIWAKNFGGADPAYVSARALVFDGSANIYLGGYFYNASLTVPALTRIGSADALIIKLAADTGAIAWAKNFGGAGANVDAGLGLAVDGAGSVYLGSSFYNNNLTTPALTRIGVRDAFVVKLVAGTGDMTWARNFGGNNARTWGQGLAVDGSGGLYLGGYFADGNLTTPPLPRIGVGDALVIRLATANGDVVWARNFGGAGATARGAGLAIDGAGDLFLGGYFSGASLTTPALTKLGNADAFAIKLAATDGSTAWSQNFGGARPAEAYGLALAVGGSGNVDLSGYFGGANLTTPALTKIGYVDAFVFSLSYGVAYDGNGSDAGAAPAAADHLTNTAVTVAGNTGGLTRANHSFAGWNTTADGSGTAYSPGAIFAMPMVNTTLYAQWTVNQLIITTQPSATARSGEALARQPVIQVRDATNSAVSQAGVVVMAALSTGTGSLVGSATATTNGSGMATFTNLGLSGAIGTYRLTFTAPGLIATPESDPVALAAGVGHHLVFAQQPSNVGAGAAISPAVTVQVLDQFGNVVTGDTRNVTLAIDSNPGSATLSGTRTVAAVSGVATFSDLSLDKAGTGYTLTATSGALTGATSNAFNVMAAGTVARLRVDVPAQVTAGNPFTFTVTALDPFDNIATGYAGTVRFTSTDPQATLPGDAALTNGVGTFTATLKSAGAHTITVTEVAGATSATTRAQAAAPISGTSQAVTVGPAAAATLQMVTPATAAAGQAFSFSVTAKDPYGNTATGYGGTIAFSSTDAGATLPAPAPLSKGVGTFTATFATGGGQQLTAIDTQTGVRGSSDLLVLIANPVPVLSPPALALLVVALGALAPAMLLRRRTRA